MNMRTKKTRDTYVRVLILFIVVLGGFFRLFHAKENFRFGVDQYYDVAMFSQINDILRSGQWEKLPLRGQQGTYPLDPSKNDTWAYNGAFYTYFFTTLAWLVGNTPEGLMGIGMALSILSIPIAYGVGATLFGRRVGVLFALLVAFSYRMGEMSRIFWTPTPLPFFTLLAWWGYAQILRGKRAYWPFFACMVSAASQIHNAGYFLPVFFTIAVLFQRPLGPTGLRARLATVVSFLLPILPTLWVEITGGFVLLRAVSIALWTQLSTSLTSSPAVTRIIWEWVYYLRAAIGELPDISDLGAAWKVFYVLLGIGGLIMLGHVIRGWGKIFAIHRQSPWILLLLWGVLFLPFPWIDAVYYGTPLRSYNDNMIGLSLGAPVVLLFFALIVDLMIGRRSLRLYGLVLCFFMIGLNVFTIHRSLWEDQTGNLNYGQKVEIVERINRDRGSASFSVNFLEDSKNGYELLYLFQKRTGTLPQFFNGSARWRGIMTLPGGHADVIYTVVYQKALINHGPDEKWGVPIGGTRNLLVFKHISQ